MGGKMKSGTFIAIFGLVFVLVYGVSGATVDITPDILYGQMPVTISYTGLNDTDWISLGFQPTYVSEESGFMGLERAFILLPFNLTGVWFGGGDGNMTGDPMDFFSETYDFSGMTEGLVYFNLMKNVSAPGEQVTSSYYIAGEKESGETTGQMGLLLPLFNPPRGILNVTVLINEDVWQKDIPYMQDISIPFAYVDDVTVQSGNTVNGNLTLYDLSNGLTLYNATLTIEDDSICHFTNAVLPNGFSGTPVISANRIDINASTSMSGTIDDIPVLDITYLGVNPGSSMVNVTLNRVLDSEGNEYPVGEGYPGTLTVTPPPSPEVDFIGTPTKGIVPFNVSFQYLPADSPSAFNWSFGDGTPNATVRNPVHTYWTPGSHNVTLTVNRTAGLNTTTKAGYIESKEVTLWFMSNQTSGTAPLMVTFNGTTNVPSSNWNYYFGDGLSGPGPNTTHIYTTPGTYSVKATADITGAKNSAIRYNYISVT